MTERITITIEKELLAWIDKKIEDKTFANRSHALEYLIKRKMETG
jgi:metal-responsive CopG/Arc/MetJ family transcriptional regulator